MQPSLGFAGIGLMGLPMARRLLAAGHPLRVWNRSPEKCAALVDAGAATVASAALLCDETELVMLCLADTAAVRQVVFGEGGIVERARPGDLVMTLGAGDISLIGLEVISLLRSGASA